MRFIANVLWFIFGGLASFLLYTVAGLVLCLTIIGIPFGLQFFKLGQLMLAPFGKEVVYGGKGGSFILNMFWLILFGWETALFSFILGLIYCITIIGIPVGIQVIKFAKLSLMPFGSEIRKISKPDKADKTSESSKPQESQEAQEADNPTETPEVIEAETTEVVEVATTEPQPDPATPPAAPATPPATPPAEPTTPPAAPAAPTPPTTPPEPPVTPPTPPQPTA